MPPPPIYEELPDDEFVYDTDFLTLIDGTNEPGGGLTLAHGAQDATIVALIPWNKRRSAVRRLLGYSTADTGSPYRIYREPPMCHPDMPTLRASGVTMTGFGIKAGTWGEGGTFTPTNPNGQPYLESPFLGPAGETLRSAQYVYALTTVRYRSYGMMRFLPDADIDDYTDEWKRYFTINTTASVETLSADGASNLIFAEGAPSGTAFPAPLAQLYPKANVNMTWVSVPHNYISSDPIAFIPTKLIERLGTWNNDNFIGYDIGTMLFLGFEAESVQFPILSPDPLNDIPFVGWNVTLHFSHTDQEKGVPTSAYRGHRIFPYRIDGKWYFATRNGSTTGEELLPGTEHWKLFQHALDPS